MDQPSRYYQNEILGHLIITYQWLMIIDNVE